jgi:adenylate cyclase
VAKVGQQLGVRYVVEGSIRRASKRVRVTAQLIDAATGNHVWAERYDRDLEDIFAVQDDVVQSIVAALAERVSAAEVERMTRRPITDMAVYDLILRAHHQLGIWTNESYMKARELLHVAVELDPNCAQAHGMLSWCCVFLNWFEGELESSLDVAMESARQALSLDPHCVEAHFGLGWIYLLSAEHDTALHHFETAVKLNPNNADTILHLGYCRAMLGDPQAGLETIGQSLRLNPYHPDWYHESFGEVLYMAGSYKGAIEAFNRMGHKPPWSHGYLAASYAQLGRMDAARAAAQTFEDAAIEGFTVKDYIEMDLPMYREKAIKDHWLEGYRKAGLKV